MDQEKYNDHFLDVSCKIVRKLDRHQILKVSKVLFGEPVGYVTLLREADPHLFLEKPDCFLQRQERIPLVAPGAAMKCNLLERAGRHQVREPPFLPGEWCRPSDNADKIPAPTAAPRLRGDRRTPPSPSITRPCVVHFLFPVLSSRVPGFDCRGQRSGPRARGNGAPARSSSSKGLKISVQRESMGCLQYSGGRSPR